MKNLITPLAIFLDFSKVFNTLAHEIILYKLKNNCAIDKALFLFQNYLTNISQYTELVGLKSNTVCLKLKLVYQRLNFRTFVVLVSIFMILLIIITKYLKTINYVDFHCRFRQYYEKQTRAEDL